MLRDQLRSKVISNLCIAIEKGMTIAYETLYLALKTLGA